MWQESGFLLTRFPSRTLLPFFFLGSLIPIKNQNSRTKGTLISRGLLGNQVNEFTLSYHNRDL